MTIVMLAHTRALRVATPLCHDATTVYARMYASNASDHSSFTAPDGVDGESDEGHTPPPNPLKPILRTSLLAQEAACSLWRGRSRMQGPRPDLAAFTAQEANLLSQLQTVAATNAPLRPSALAPLANLGFAALGAVAAILPPKPSAAILAGLQSALTDHYNDSLRQLREAGVAESTNDVRAVLRVVRDVERAPEGAPRVPDILALQRLGEVSVAEGVAGVVAAGTKAMLALARTV